MTPHQIAAEVTRRGVDNFWGPRIREMASFGQITHGTEHGDKAVSDYVKVVRISKAWPQRGTITLQRQDGVQVVLGMSKDQFTVTHRT